jgi:predicted Kef-type K+ transport protein
MEALWVGLSFILGFLSRKVSLPPLVGYLLAGFLLAAFGVKTSLTLHTVAEIGVLLLLFSVGLKLRLADLLHPTILGVGGLHLVVISLSFMAIFIASGQGFKGSVFLGVGVAFSSTVLAIKILEDKRELSAFHGRLSVGILILQDLVAVGLLTWSGVKMPSWWLLLLLLLPLLRPLLIWLLEKSGHGEVLLMYGLALSLAGGALASLAGVSSELGALLFGVSLARHRQTSELSKLLWGLKEVFLVAFFLEFGLLGFPDSVGLLWVLVLLLLLSIKGLLFFYLFVRFGLRSRTAFIASLTLSSYSEFALILSAGAIRTGDLESNWGPILGLTVALSLVVAAPLNRLSHSLYSRFEPWLQRLEPSGLHPDDEPTQLKNANWLIVGMGRTGSAAYHWLENKGHRVMGFDSDPAKIETHIKQDRNVVYGDAEDSQLWDNLSLTGLKGVLLAMPELEAKLITLRQLRQRGFAGIIASTSYHYDEDALLREAGVSLILHPFSEAGERMAERITESV